jgi:hypothetical protein
MPVCNGQFVGGVTLAIINVMPLKPAGTVVMYEIQARA